MAWKEHCPECGAQLIHQSGCVVCYACGYCECESGEGFKPLFFS
jgi:uncharacterized Zn finger protein (UPF0148 family)